MAFICKALQGRLGLKDKCCNWQYSDPGRANPEFRKTGDHIGKLKCNFKDIHGVTVNMHQLQGEVLLVVNTASECGLDRGATSVHIEELNALHAEFSDQGLIIIAFPTDSFDQEPLDLRGLQAWRREHKIEFPILLDGFCEKIYVNDRGAHMQHQFYKYIKSSFGVNPESIGAPSTNDIPWNYCKFLIDRSGYPYHRYSPNVNPSSLRDAVKELLDHRHT